MKRLDGRTLTVVMYHYVRPAPGPGEPRLLGALTPALLDAQLDYIARHYTVVSLRDVFEARLGERPLPERSLLLTFDDGLTDHARHVAPLLRKRAWPAALFVCADTPRRDRMLVVHRIHHLVAHAYDAPDALVADVKTAVHERAAPDLPSVDELVERWWRPNPFDPPAINFIKRTLQRGIPAAAAEEITRELFARRVSADEADFAATFYLGETELRALIDAGMEVGGHGADHAWLDSLPPDEQERQIRRSLAMLERLYGALPASWAFSYPFGGFDSTTLDLLDRYRCSLAFTVAPDIARAATHRLEVPRLDTRDLPFAGESPAVEWTRVAG